ncbi:MAG: NAD(+) synthase [Elusimicrobia bacterium]|nr:NAD(+) synthase [Elusimicrobiota bacterium]
MKAIRLGAAALNQVPFDWDGNLARILAAIEAAKASGVSVLCLPEMCVTGYGCEDSFHAEFVHETAWAQLQKLLPSTKGIAVGVGLPVFHGGALYNAAALLCDGALMGLSAKKHLAGDGIHYEPRWFKPWTKGAVDTLSAGGQSVPFGDLCFKCGEVGVGFEICEEAWVPDRPGGDLAARGADIILNPSASHFAFGKEETRRRFVAEGSRAFGAAYCYANLLGNESGRVIYDGTCLVASEGRVLAFGKRFGFDDFSLTWADADLTKNRMAKARSANFKPHSGTDPGLVTRAFSLPEPKSRAQAFPLAGWESGPSIKEEEFCRAVALGLFDYLRKSRSRGFVVSLSGGADSTAVTCLAGLALRLASESLGPQGLSKKLPHLPPATLADSRALIKSLLVCVYQATDNSSSSSRSAARAVASGVGAEFMEWEVNAIVTAYTDMVSKTVGRPLTWEKDDISLQNIQARARGPGAWLLANLRDSLLLATSDRSEASVGYATMDGDTCGGLAPIGGVDKCFLLSWLKWLEKTGPEGLGPIPALSVVTSQRPTPELRPSSAKQAAEKDLMPYDVLDAIQRAFILDKRSPAEALAEVREKFPEHTPEDLKTWVGRFFSLWCRNQWKRERYAPSFHLDDQDVDPRSWCRFPILSSGLAKEIKDLDAA